MASHRSALTLRPFPPHQGVSNVTAERRLLSTSMDPQQPEAGEMADIVRRKFDS
jgi:hypothetical protein